MWQWSKPSLSGIWEPIGSAETPCCGTFTGLGEASAQLSAEVKDQFADVAWRQPVRLRNRIAHGYWSIDLDIVHTTALEQLPGFAADLKRVLTAVSAEGD